MNTLYPRADLNIIIAQVERGMFLKACRLGMRSYKLDVPLALWECRN